MNIRLAALLFVPLIAASFPTLAQHPHAAPPVQANAHARFQADVPLSREMAALRSSFAQQLPAIRAGRLDAAGYATLGTEVETRVTTIVRECRLPPDADAVLHAYIGRMLTAAGQMRDAGLDPAAHRKAALEVIATYNEYGSRFVDSAWAKLTP